MDQGSRTEAAASWREDAQRGWRFKQLRWSLQALADAGSGQQSLFPDRRVTADDLAFDFDHWSSFVEGTDAGELTGAQADALAEIRRKLATISRDGAEFDVELWTDAALATSEHWADVRSLAAAALEAFGWSATPPDVGTESTGLIGETS